MKMKTKIYTAFAAAALLCGCVDLDLAPLSEGSSENWFTNEQEVTYALNALYDPTLWYAECSRLWHTDRWSDDWNQRGQVYEFVGGTLESTTGHVTQSWAQHYKAIVRANTILSSLDKAKDSMSEEKLAQYAGEAKFFRAVFYSYQIFLFGDVPAYWEYMTLEEAYKIGRTDKNVILKRIYEDFDEAARVLPTEYAGIQRVTKGAALAMKARTALWFNDWETCAAAAKACMDLGVYSLHPDFREFFLSKTKTSPELIFALPCSNELGIHSYAEASTKSFVPRNNGGNSVAQPSWELFFAFPCIDGMLVEESPLYDPANPFANRDPRLAETVAEFDKEFMDYIYNPRASASTTLQVSSGKQVKNNDNRKVNPNCSYNGLVLKKHVDEEWFDDNLTDAPIRIVRYGDVLLMYAEAMFELGRCDQEVLDATVNALRARAYKCGVGDAGKYPRVMPSGNPGRQNLRQILRNERHCELAWENRRWFDLIRWRLCDDALTRPIYGLPAPTDMDGNEKTGYWLFPKDFRPHMLASSLIDLSDIENYKKYYTINVQRTFVPREYLHPIPLNERVVCPNLTQNPGY